MISDNDKLKKLNSMNIKLQREITNKLDGDLQNMTISCNDLLQELRVKKLKNEFEREEFEK